MKAKKFDKLFDAGKDIVPHLDLKSAKRPGRAIQRVNVDFPTWVVESLDLEAERLGVTRQSVIKMWIAEKLDKTSRAS